MCHQKTSIRLWRDHNQCECPSSANCFLFSLDEKLTILISQYPQQLNIGSTDSIFDHHAFHRYEVWGSFVISFYSVSYLRLFSQESHIHSTSLAKSGPVIRGERPLAVMMRKAKFMENLQNPREGERCSRKDSRRPRWKSQKKRRATWVECTII